MAIQESKYLLLKLKDLSTFLGCSIKVRSLTPHGFTFIPSNISVPDAFCKLYKSNIQYNTMRLCETPQHQYWIEITFTDIPMRKAEYWNGKKFKEYNA